VIAAEGTTDADAERDRDESHGCESNRHRTEDNPEHVTPPLPLSEICLAAHAEDDLAAAIRASIALP
jgi:hypothetical protein